MKELRQAAVLGVLACGLALASACGSDGDSGAAGQNGGSAGASQGGTSQAGRGGSANAAGTSGASVGGSQGYAGSVANGGTGMAGAAGDSNGGNAGNDNAGGAGGDNASSAGAGGTTDIQGGNPAYKVVFVTSTFYQGNFGGVVGADGKCQERAVAAKLAGTYKAWLSADDLESSPSKRFIHSTVPYRLLDGSVVANDWADLTDGTLQHPISLSELRTTLSSFALTFTLIDGTPGHAGSATPTCYDTNCNCDNWTSNSSTPGSAVGQDYGVDSKWTDYSYGNFCGGPADDGLSLFCFEQ